MSAYFNPTALSKINTLFREMENLTVNDMIEHLGHKTASEFSEICQNWCNDIRQFYALKKKMLHECGKHGPNAFLTHPHLPQLTEYEQRILKRTDTMMIYCVTLKKKRIQAFLGQQS